MADYNMLGDLDLKNLLDRFAKGFLQKINCVKVGKISSFDATNQTATVEIDGYPTLANVPVSFICGANFSIQIPVESGDDCIVLFSDADLDNWIEGKGAEPAFGQDAHGLNGAVALLGIKNILTKIDNYITSGIRVKYKDTVLEVKEDGISANKDVSINGNLNVSGNISADGDIVSGGKMEAGNGASGTFKDTGDNAAGQTLTIVKGIITQIT